MATETAERVRFEKVDGGYDVWLVEGSSSAPVGMVERTTVSTDSKIAGTRLRRQGKGRTVWRARVPLEEARAVGGRGGRELVRGWSKPGEPDPLRVEWSGQNCETRLEAAELLVAWHEHLELRQGPAR